MRQDSKTSPPVMNGSSSSASPSSTNPTTASDAYRTGFLGTSGSQTTGTCREESSASANHLLKRSLPVAVVSDSLNDEQRPTKRRALDELIPVVEATCLVTPSLSTSPVSAASASPKDVAAPKVKKSEAPKKKKFRSLLKSMMTSKPKDVQKERQDLLKGLGGGDFEKVAKI
eukprot:Nitzschia sp. Nitz4//scaffold100_size80364//37656//38171//NITZ4_005344-RA/size80364-processed-gene-0.50-mRNA-1//-1//CDS//3329532094//2817//frame0